MRLLDAAGGEAGNTALLSEHTPKKTGAPRQEQIKEQVEQGGAGPHETAVSKGRLKQTQNQFLTLKFGKTKSIKSNPEATHCP